MPLKYNPLLSIGLEDAGNGGSSEQIAALQQAVTNLQQQATILQNAVNALKGNKITKCFVAADLVYLESGEIFEWQGVDSTIDDVAFKNGFFYKKTISPSVIVAPVQAADVTNCDFVYNNVQYQNGLYYQKDSSQPISLSNSYYIVRFFGGTIPANVGLWTILNGLARGQVFKYIVNGVITNIVLYNFYRIGQGGAFHLTFTNGLEFESDGYGGNIISYSRTVVDANNNYYYLGFDAEASSQGDNFLFLDENHNVVDFVPCYSRLRTINQDVTISVSTYQQTDTQPTYSLPTAAANLLGGIKVGSGLSIDGNGVLSASGGSPVFFSVSSDDDIIVNESLVFLKDGLLHYLLQFRLIQEVYPYSYFLRCTAINANNISFRPDPNAPNYSGIAIGDFLSAGNYFMNFSDFSVVSNGFNLDSAFTENIEYLAFGVFPVVVS